MGALLADIAHELNNPLSIILGHAAILYQTLADTPSAEQAEKIVQAAEKCARIMSNFLALARQRIAGAICGAGEAGGAGGADIGGG